MWSSTSVLRVVTIAIITVAVISYMEHKSASERPTRASNDLISAGVDGGFSQWSDLTKCTKECGTGTRSRVRTCTNPTPALGGLNCSGSNTETFRCNMLPCGINGGYGAWSEYGECSKPCGGGEKQRERKCDAPLPKNHGQTCLEQELGPDKETLPCNEQPCPVPVDGGYGAWSDFSECSVTCGGGQQSKTRKCDNPAPANGGQTCDKLGPAVESKQCGTDPCPAKV